MPPLRISGWVGSFLISASITSYAAENEAGLRVFPAWNGAVKSAFVTELQIAVIPRASGHVTLRVQPSDVSRGEQLHRFSAHKGEQSALSIPIRVGNAGTLRLSIDRGERTPASVDVQLTILRGRHIAVTVEDLDVLDFMPPQSDSLHISHVPAKRLPRLVGSYGGVDLLVIQSSDLARIDATQRRALEMHVENCGRTIIFGPEHGDQAASLAARGCMSSTAFATDVQGLARAGALMLSTPTTSEPPEIALSELLPEYSASTIWLLAAAIFAYFVATIFAAWSFAQSPFLLCIPVALCIVVAAGFTGGPNDIDRVIWRETSGTNSFARSTELTRIFGNTLSTSQVQLPFADLTEIPVTEAPLFFDHDDRLIRASDRTPLLASRDLVTRSIVERRSSLTLHLSRSLPTVVNSTGQTSTPAILVWNDQKYSVPELIAGESWSPADVEPTSWSATALDRVLRRRAMSHRTLLLAEKSEGASNHQNVRSYLVVLP